MVCLTGVLGAICRFFPGKEKERKTQSSLNLLFSLDPGKCLNLNFQVGLDAVSSVFRFFRAWWPGLSTFPREEVIFLARLQLQQQILERIKIACASVSDGTKASTTLTWIIAYTMIWISPLRIIYVFFFFFSWTMVPPPGTKPIHAGNISGGINICANTCRACIRTRANTENTFEEIFSKHFAELLWEFIQNFWCQYIPRLYSHPREYRKTFPGELFMYWFRARRIYPRSGFWVQEYTKNQWHSFFFFCQGSITWKDF